MIRYALFRRVAALAVALTLTVAGATGTIVLSSESANAASQRSYGGYWSPYGGFIGNYLNPQTGTFVYCVDLWATDVASGGIGVSANEIGAHSGGMISGELGQTLGGTRSVKGADLQKLNYAVSVHGQTTDNFTAAAVAAYVWSITSDNFYGRGDHFISGPYAAQIIAKYQQIVADTEKNYDSGGAGSGQISLTTDPENNYRGTVEIHGLDPSHALGSVTLSNAVFADSGSATQNGLVNNTELDIIAVPPTNTASFSVQSEASFVAPIPVTYAANVQLFKDTGQRSVGPGESRDLVKFQLHAEDTVPRSVVFQPTVSTSVAAKYVQHGEQFADVLHFSTVADANGVHNPWFQEADLSYAPVTAIGTLYGPFLSQPSESDTVPVNAPIAADNIRVTTDPITGPTVDYTANSEVTSVEAGYYTWVWRISAADQTENTRTYLPTDYAFTDRFGQTTETSITPSDLSISTVASTAQAHFGASVNDRVTLGVIQGGWLQTANDRAQVKLTGSAYFTTTQPVLAAAPPPNAEIIGNLVLTVNKPGSYLSEHITLPNKPGYVTFQWCLLPEEQPEELRNMFNATCDMFGQPSETIRVVTNESLASTGQKNAASEKVLLASASTFTAGAGIIGLGVSALGKPRRRR